MSGGFDLGITLKGKKVLTHIHMTPVFLCTTFLVGFGIGDILVPT
jgi:hypothetical protein